MRLDEMIALEFKMANVLVDKFVDDMIHTLYPVCKKALTHCGYTFLHASLNAVEFPCMLWIPNSRQLDQLSTLCMHARHE